MFKLLKHLIIFIITLILLVCTYFVYSGYTMYKTAVSEINIEDKVKQIMESENYTSINDMPQIYKDAVVSIEDHRFYDHSGVDYISIVRAIFINFQKGELNQGGSTITQQLAKNIYFTQEKQFTRKIAEIFVAKQLESNYSKDKILELYINTMYFGQGYYGIKEASNGFFSKEPKELTDYESTYLAGIPNAPSIYSSPKHADLAKQRHKLVLNSMVKYNKLSEQKADDIFAE